MYPRILRKYLPNATWNKSAISTWDKVRAHILSAVNFTPIVTGDTKVNTNAVLLSGGCTIWYYPRHFKSLISRRNGQSLRWISIFCLFRRYIEEPGVEKARFLDETSILDFACVLRFPRRIEVCFPIKSILWDVAMDIFSSMQQVPEFFI